MYAALTEAALVGQEVLQMWAYMHQRGPMSYLISLVRGDFRKKVAPQQEEPEKVPAPPVKRKKHFR